MKKTFFSILIALISISLGCNSQKKSTGEVLTIGYQVDSSYILLPVEESAPEVKVKVVTPSLNDQPTYDIHLALNKIDYWVPLDVKNFIGQKLTLSFPGLKESILGISEIKQSDRFNFEYNETFRPQFHFTPQYGWMNDPNGMVYLDGEYHLFYQYNPYGSMWGNMHWGHAVSTDMVSWTYLPIAIAPDSLGTIFSGSAVVDTNNTAGFGKNTIVAIFTSNGKTQRQSIAYSTDKGRSFTKYTGNPVLPNPGITDFRDPKVSWNEVSNQWIMTLATKQTITFFGSPDLKKWTKLSEFGQGLGSHAGVWECPDLFPLKYQGATKWILTVSINPGGPNGGSATQYFIGSFDGSKFTADPLPYPLWMDYGRDNYAGVTWSNIPKSDGRRLFLGWMSNWDYATTVPTLNFRSANTTPRELSLGMNGDHMIVKSFPVKEMNTVRGVSKIFPNQLVKKEATLSGLLLNNKGTYEVLMTLKPQHTSTFGFELKNSKGELLKFTFDLKTNKLTIDRDKSGKINFNDKFKSGTSAPIVTKGSYNIRLLVDKASAEIFIDNGEIAMTTIFFPTEIMNSMTLFTHEGSLKAENITIYNIK